MPLDAPALVADTPLQELTAPAVVVERPELPWAFHWLIVDVYHHNFPLKGLFSAEFYEETLKFLSELV